MTLLHSLIYLACHSTTETGERGAAGCASPRAVLFLGFLGDQKVMSDLSNVFTIR